MSGFGSPGDGCGGHWAPRDFGIFLARQTAWQAMYKRRSYNEIIVDGPHMTAHLPTPIEAFIGDSGYHSKFLAEHGLTSDDVPLVSLHLGGNGDAVS